jgi:5S rRNA maturation endonuclease (ribonuclease M5)
LSNDQFFQAKLNVLSKMVVNDLDKLFELLDVSLVLSGNKYVGACPIHGGDNESALNLYYDGYDVPGFWRCRTHQCEITFGKNIIGFTRGVLSRQELDYDSERNTKAIYGFRKTIDYLCKFTNTNFANIRFDHKKADRQTFVAETLRGTKTYVSQTTGISRTEVRSSLILPAPYFIARGYSSSILDSYDIGMPKRAKPENEGRAIIPIYNEKELMIGYTARSIYERCTECKLFHKQGEVCPQNNYDRNICSKWRHIDFESSLHLFNYWRAKPYMIESNTAILVEGPGDVLRLEEAGIHNGVAMFGVSLSRAQQTLLSHSQVMTMILLLDDDIPGKEAAQQIKNEYGRLYRMYFPKMPSGSKDVGDLNTDRITNEILPIINKLKNE